MTDWLSPTEKSTPLWLRTLYATLPVSAVCILHGEVHDLHAISASGRFRPETTIDAIWQVLSEAGFQGLLTFDPVNGLNIRKANANWSKDRIKAALYRSTNPELVDRLLRTPTERALAGNGDSESGSVGFRGMDAIAVAVAQSQDPALALVIDYTSQMRDDNSGDDPDLRQLMLTSLMLSNTHATLNDKQIRFPWANQGGQFRHPIIWLVDQPDDLPNWLTRGDGIRQIPIVIPDVDARRRIAELLLSTRINSDMLPQVAQRFADATEGITTRGMFESLQLAPQPDNNGDLDIEGAVRNYREGLSENPWQSPRLREQLAQGEAVLRRRVKGQDAAVDRVLDILKRSALGLTNAHQPQLSSAPRGVLYFAGATGVGKTEMAKAIAELVFADERALLRFDMSEFQDDHAKIRLVGAPPSYIGYGAGGELTNAILQRPQSVVLFDEMDKAGSQVYDLFLQILSDGRLTDGQGQTVNFSETLIIFTSNQGAIGATAQKLDMDDAASVQRYEHIIREAVKAKFTLPSHEGGLGRPEILGRLGSANIIVFRKMHGRVASELANTFIDEIVKSVRNRVGHKVELTDAARNQLVAAVTTDSVLEEGGRGITKALENCFTNPLGRIIFNLNPGVVLQITGIISPADNEQANLEYVVQT